MSNKKESALAVQNNEQWDKVITAKKRLLDLHLRDVWDYRYLIKMFIKRDFVVAYKQTILGPIWYLVQPLITAFNTNTTRSIISAATASTEQATVLLLRKLPR